MSKYVAIEVLGKLEIHLPDVSGNYATLCGSDGDDPNDAVQQRMANVPKGAKVTCRACWNIFLVCSEFKVRDFDAAAMGSAS
ncbi:MAG: hypothetical protein E6R03_10725 [Hyphomicrobiaceae bacterium]|nr:MAG: hypothetical protein E6R03_10725 [Hyphomicrobiaceae bacterium]